MNNLIHRSLYFIILIVGFFLIYLNNQDLRYLQFFLVCLMFIFTVTIIFLPIIKSDFIGKLPIIYLINFYFLICYLGIFLFDKNFILNENYSLNDHEKAINILFIGYSFFLMGYFFAKKIFKNFKRKSFIYLDASRSEIFFIGVLILFSTIILFYLTEIQIYFSYLSQVKYPMILFGIGLCVNRILQKKLKYLQLFILIILVITPIFLELLSGSYNFPFMIIFLIYVHYVVYKQKINLLPFFIIVLFFSFIHIGKYDYRSQIWNEKNSNLNILDKSKIFFDYYFKPNDLMTLDGNLKAKDLNIDYYTKTHDNYKLERRVFHSYWSLVIVTKNTPQKVPYWDGYSYKMMFSRIIPRIFWKNKPSDTLGNEFGHRYNVLTKDTALNKRDNSTSWNMPILNEFYVNFGQPGVIFGMLLIGAVMNLLTRIGTFKKNYNLETIFSFYLFIPLFFFESHLSLLFGAIIQSYLFLIVISFCTLFFIRKIVFKVK
jgi:hypothetical protein